MNNFDNFFDNLFPLRPLMPFVQSVLPTVFDDSLSYLETLGKVVKALNDTESNVNTLEQAVRAFADDLAQYENLSITPVEITFNNDTGRYTASMTYANIMSALDEGHTVIMHVSGSVYDLTLDFYSAALKAETTTSGNVKVLYWDSPVYSIDGNSIVYRAFINEYDTVGVSRHMIGSNAFVIHYDSDTETADKTFAEIVAAIEAEKDVKLFADNFLISNARWTISGNEDNLETVSVQFNAFNVVSSPSGKNLGCVTYAVDNANAWTVTRNGFPNESRVNALIDVAIAQLEGFNSIVKLSYNETTGAVTYWDGAQTINASGQYIANNLVDSALPQMIILEGIEQHSGGMQTVNTYLPAEYGQTTGAWFIDFYRVYDGNVEMVRIPYASNIAVKTLTPVDGSSITVDSALSGTSENPVQNRVIKAALDAKQDALTAGQNVTISGNTISADVDSTEIASNVTNWLTANVNPVGSAVVVDSSLSISGAAADAKVTGEFKNAISKVTENLFDGNYSAFSNMELIDGKVQNTAVDTRAAFNAQVKFRNRSTVVITSDAQYISTTGRKRFTVTPASDGDNIMIVHNGAQRNLSCTIPFNFVGGATYTVSFDVESYDVQTVGGLVISNIQIETGSTASKYVPHLTAIDAIARDDIGELDARVTELERIDPLPEYWSDYLAARIPTIRNAIYQVGNHGVVFAFFTDYHYNDSEVNYQGFTWLPDIMRRIKTECPVEDFIFGGDILDTEPTRENALTILEKYREDYNFLGIKNINGNHDNNPYGAEQLSIDDVYSILFRGMGMEESVHLMPKLYWYSDNEVQKVRIIALNTGEGVFNAWSSDTEQHRWFIDTLNTTPAGYTVIIMPHVFFGLSNGELVLSSIGENIKSIVDAYANRSSGTWNTLQYDFTNAAAVIACILTGHTHNDGMIQSAAGYPIIGTVCDAMWGSGQNVQRGTSAIGTIAEHAFDIVCIDTTAKTINCVRVGSGANRTYNYS